MCLKKWITKALAIVVMHGSLATIAGAHELEARQLRGKGGDVTLQSFNGPVSIRELRGKVVLLFFGYTSCVDVCPIVLWTLSKVFSELSEEELEKVEALFVSLDPGRDTPEVLRKYTQLFHPKIIGVTADEETLGEVVKKYGVAFERREEPSSERGYAIYHTTDVLVVDSAGELLEERIGLSAGSGEIAARIRKVLPPSH